MSVAANSEAFLLRPFAIPGQPPGLTLSRGEGHSVFDQQGRCYLDAAAGLWNVTLGLGSGSIFERARRQMEELAYAPLFDQSHLVGERLAARLVELSEGAMRHAYLSTTGSSAVEMALRTARLHFRARNKPEKRLILSFDLGYHGCSAMTLSASGIVHDEMEGLEDPLPDFAILPAPDDEQGSLDAFRSLLARDGDRVCCLVMEPILGSGGIVVPSRDYCQAVSALCREHDVLLIADEVATGGGRCGAFYASAAVGLEPHIIALSKGLSSGYFPIGATLFAREVIDPLAAARIQILYGSTQDGNPIGCAAALAAIDCVIDQELCARATALGTGIRSRLAPLTGSGVVRSVRGMGLMIGLELAHLRDGRPLFTEQESVEVRRLCREEGLLVYHFRSGISLFPALTFTEDDVDDMVEILTDVLGGLA